MAKKGSLLKTVIGLGSLAVAGKVAYDKYRNTKEKYVKEEKESADDVVKKYNAIAESKVIEIQDEEFEGCEIKASASKVVLDLSLAVIEKDVYNTMYDSAICQNKIYLISDFSEGWSAGYHISVPYLSETVRIIMLTCFHTQLVLVTACCGDEGPAHVSETVSIR